MTATITVTTTIEVATRVVTCVVNDGADIPQDIFMYENNNGIPGDYVAVCSLTDYERFQTYTGTPIPVFGNKFIKQTTGRKVISLYDDSFTAIEPWFITSCQKFRTEYLGMSVPVSTTYTL